MLKAGAVPGPYLIVAGVFRSRCAWRRYAV
jgi:hypothetical protein